MRNRPGTAQDGISLVEVLVAMAIALLVTALATVLTIEAQATWAADSARLDVQQRSRAAADLLTRALRDAGGGGPTAGGPLVHAFAPVLPRRIGARDAHAPEVFRRDAISIVRGAGDADHAVLLTGAPPGTAVLDLAPGPGCTLLPCGLAEGEHVVLFDRTGRFDLFTVVALDGAAASVRHHGGGSAAPYPPGSPVLPVHSGTYYLDPAARILRTYDGDRSDLPLVDDVVEMDVEYSGDPRPPLLPKPPAGDGNCLFGADGSYLAALMPPLAAPAGLAPLPPGILTDGPWCGSGGNRFDADLLRVRRIRVRLRLQASSPSVRGTAPGLFRHPGTAGPDAVPDVSVTIDVSPPNLAFGARE